MPRPSEDPVAAVVRWLNEAPGTSLSLLAADAEEQYCGTDRNPFESDSAYRRSVFGELETLEIVDLGDLVAADKLLEIMWASPSAHASRAFAVLEAKVCAFIRRFPELLEMGWVYSGGCVYELLEQMRLAPPGAQPAH